jgi:hypothetical protein
MLRISILVILCAYVNSFSFSAAGGNNLYPLHVENHASDGQRGDVSVFLLSFPELYHDEKETSFANRLMKRWKTYILGDGGVYFDQRPNSLRELNKHISVSMVNSLLDRCHDNSVNVETAVISTCARFEVLVAVEMESMDEQHETYFQDLVLKIISEQIIAFRCKTRWRNLNYFYIMKRMKYIAFKILPFSPRDNPNRIYNGTIRDEWFHDIQDMTRALSKSAVVRNDIQDICRRLCSMASGLDRPYFRPFSARDSHIISQMKRSSEGIVKSSQSVSKSSSTYCKLLFDSALHSGKASRSSKVVPLLDELRLVSKGADGPRELSLRAAECAKLFAVEPSVSQCYSKFNSMKRAKDVSDFRYRASTLVSQFGLKLESDECAIIRSILHQPTIDIRNGLNIKTDDVLAEIQAELSRINLVQ